MAGKKSDTSDKGFTVVDRRIKVDEEQEGAPAQSEKKPAEKEKAAGQVKEAQSRPAVPAEERTCPEPAPAGRPDEARERPPAPPVNFPTFLLSLHTAALIHLGIIPDPVSQQCLVSLELARQNIDLLEILQEKTRGNRTPDEDRLLENILYELRMAYINVAGEAHKGEADK